MKDISNHDENEDLNIIATTLADSINTYHIDALPQNDSDMMDASQDRNSGNNSNLGPQLKETAVPKKCCPCPPSPSSDGHSDGPDLNQGSTATKKQESSRHSYGFLHKRGSDNPSSPGSPNISTKHHQLSSPIKGKKLLFEPTVIKEYVWLPPPPIYLTHAEYMLQMKKETISLSLELNPPIIKGDKSYTVFDVEGNPEMFTPCFHVSC